MKNYPKMPEDLNKTDKKRRINGGGYIDSIKYNGDGYNVSLAPKRTSFNVEKLTPSGLEQKIIGCQEQINNLIIIHKEACKIWPNETDLTDFYKELIDHHKKTKIDCQNKLDEANAYLINVQSPKL